MDRASRTDDREKRRERACDGGGGGAAGDAVVVVAAVGSSARVANAATAAADADAVVVAVAWRWRECTALEKNGVAPTEESAEKGGASRVVVGHKNDTDRRRRQLAHVRRSQRKLRAACEVRAHALRAVGAALERTDEGGCAVVLGRRLEAVDLNALK